MENYNGEYEMHLDIIVSSATHQGCLWAYNRFKDLVKAFDFGNIHIHESKSARRGDVLSRELQINIVGYATDIIIFRECVDRIIQRSNIFLSSTQVRLNRVDTSRKDARANLIKETV